MIYFYLLLTCEGMFLLVVVSREAPHEALICPAPAVGVQAELPAGVEAPGVPVCQVALPLAVRSPASHNYSVLVTRTYSVLSANLFVWAPYQGQPVA